jgi:ComF family protein
MRHSLQLLKKAAGGLMGQDCALCGCRSPSGIVCDACESSLPRVPPGSRVVATFEYRFPIDRLVRRFKFAGDLAIGRWLALQLADRVAGEPRPDLLVVPPLTRARLRERGFNQALEIARLVGKRHGIGCAVSVIARVREAPAQHSLGRRARQRNLKGAFRCDMRLDGLRIAVIDDVLTTGATAEALARELRRCGAAQVDVWTVARTPAPGSDPGV